MTTTNDTLSVNGRKVKIENEANLLAVVRKANVEIPTFCYHSSLSVYGACRMCMVEVKGRGLVSACSTKPEPGMEILTSTDEIRNIRQTIIELLLAGTEHECTTCNKGPSCQLLSISNRLGVDNVRFKSLGKKEEVDTSSHSLVRDPNKCILCGDCTRMCSEVQGVGAIDFAWRGSKVAVVPSFGKNLDSVECVYCGQCASVCPTGALTPKSETEEVWKALNTEGKIVVAQIAPAVRVAIGECFGYDPGTSTTGQLVAALKMMGFHAVYDTSFTADLTVIEEAHEFVSRLDAGKKLPLLTSCCPAWVKFCEQYFPELKDNMSTCKSPQQMFGSVAKAYLAKQLKVDANDIVVVSLMPCTAKKFEAKRPEFARDGRPDVDHVLTTQEVARMINDAGIQFRQLRPESFDLPFGFKTGAGVIFGNAGGVTEAVVRHLAEKLNPAEVELAVEKLREDTAMRAFTAKLGERTLKVASVYSLKEARTIMESIRDGKSDYDFVEVMACPDGCVGGAGQPALPHFTETRERTRGLLDNDKMLPVHKSSDNPYIAELYAKFLGEVGGHKAHELLHTKYQPRRRIASLALDTGEDKAADALEVSVCVGTGCYVRGSKDLLARLMRYADENNLSKHVTIRANFCYETCERGPTVHMGDKTFVRCTFDEIRAAIEAQLQKRGVPANAIVTAGHSHS